MTIVHDVAEKAAVGEVKASRAIGAFVGSVAGFIVFVIAHILLFTIMMVTAVIASPLWLFPRTRPIFLEVVTEIESLM